MAGPQGGREGGREGGQGEEAGGPGGASSARLYEPLRTGPLFTGSVLDSQGSHNQAPHTRRLKQQNVFSHRPGSRKSKTMVSAGLLPSGGSEGAPASRLPPASGGLALLGIAWLVEASPQCLHLHMAFSLGVCLCPNFPFCKDTSSHYIRGPPYSSVTSFHPQ